MDGCRKIRNQEGVHICECARISLMIAELHSMASCFVINKFHSIPGLILLNLYSQYLKNEDRSNLYLLENVKF